MIRNSCCKYPTMKPMMPKSTTRIWKVRSLYNWPLKSCIGGGQAAPGEALGQGQGRRCARGSPSRAVEPGTRAVAHAAQSCVLLRGLKTETKRGGDEVEKRGG